MVFTVALVVDDPLKTKKSNYVFLFLVILNVANRAHRVYFKPNDPFEYYPELLDIISVDHTTVEAITNLPMTKTHLI